MLKIIICVFVLFFASVGFSVLTGKLWLCMLKPKKVGNANFVVVLEDGDDIAQMEYFIEKFIWYGAEFADKLYFVCENEISNECKKLCENKSNIYCCSNYKV